MDLDGDRYLDLVTANDGDIVGERGSSRREHVFRNDGEGSFRDASDALWPAGRGLPRTPPHRPSARYGSEVARRGRAGGRGRAGRCPAAGGGRSPRRLPHALVQRVPVEGPHPLSRDGGHPLRRRRRRQRGLRPA